MPKSDTQFKPGKSGNPHGRPKGSRNKLSEEFVEVLLADFLQHGKKAIEEVRKNKPEAYAKVIASLLPKQIEAEVTHYEASELSDGELEHIATGSRNGASKTPKGKAKSPAVH